MPILILIAYHFLFWHKVYLNPYRLCTSEVASTFFPHWRWMGRELRRGIFPAQDNIFYKLPGSIPFLATFYPVNLLTAYLGSLLDNDDRAFRLYAYSIIAHYFLTSLLSYFLTGSLFFAITLTYAGYCIKPNTPCFVYSVTWVPLALMGGPLGMIGWGMALMGGYFPILVYVAPVVAVMHPEAFLGGLFLALPQVLPFLGYFNRSVRMGEKVDRNFGRVPVWKLLDFVNPVRSIGTTNGVHYPEMMMYMGLAPFLIWKASWWLAPIISSFLVLTGILPSIQRIPARALYLLSLSLSMLVAGQQSMEYLVFQGFLLLKNSSIYPSFPFAQWYNRPSALYARKPKMSNWPHITGYLKGVRISEYAGAFRLRTDCAC